MCTWWIEKIRGIPRLSGEPKLICGKCMKGKQIKGPHKEIKEIMTTRPLDLLHMDLMSPMIFQDTLLWVFLKRSLKLLSSWNLYLTEYK